MAFCYNLLTFPKCAFDPCDRYHKICWEKPQGICSSFDPLMSWVLTLEKFTSDAVRQVQFFMVCRQLGIIFSSIVVAWFLPVGSVGNLELLMFVGYLMTFFWSDALLRGYLANEQLQTDRQAATSFFTLYFLGSLVAMAILVAGQSALIPLFTSREDLEGLELFALYQVLIVPLWISPFLGLLKGQNILLVSLYVLFGPAFACWTGFTSLSGETGILLGLFCYALVGIIWVLTQTTFFRKLQLRKILLSVWPATWPLVLYAVSTGLARSFDAWLVARHFDEETFAIFRYGAREFPLVVALSAGLSTVMIPKLRDYSSLDELRTRTTKVMHACYPIVGLFMFTSPLLFEQIFGPQYRDSAAIFNIYLLLTLTQLCFPQSILTARGDTKWLWYISLAELGINIIASTILLRYLGLAGIAWGTLIAFAFEKIALLFFIRSRYNISLSSIMDIPVWIGYGMALVFIFILSKWVFIV